MVFLPVVIIFIVFIFIAIWAVRREKKRTEALQAIAAHLGFEFSNDDDVRPDARYQHLKLFDRGRNKEINNVMTAAKGERSMSLFDYSFVTGSGKQRSTHYQSVLLLEDVNLDLPEFTLQPETMFHRLGKVFIGEDIDFDEHPQFSKKYFLKSDSEPAVRAMFAGDLARFFEANPGWTVESDQGILLVYRYGKRPKAADYEAFVKGTLGIVQQLT